MNSRLGTIKINTIIVLIGIGWSFLNPYLQEREKNVLMFVIPLQVLANIVSIVIIGNGPSTKDWFTWDQEFLLTDIIYCIAIIFPLVWLIKNLCEAYKNDGKEARNLEKLTLFKKFYMVIVDCLYFIIFIVYALITTIEYKHRSMSNVAKEAISLDFYIFIFYKLQLVDKKF